MTDSVTNLGDRTRINNTLGEVIATHGEATEREIAAFEQLKAQIRRIDDRFVREHYRGADRWSGQGSTVPTDDNRVAADRGRIG